MVAGGDQPVGERRTGAVRLGDQHPGRGWRELGEQPFHPGHRGDEVDGAARGGGEHPRRRRADGGKANARMLGRPGTDSRRAVGRRDGEPVERGQAGERPAEGAAPVGRVGDLDERYVHHVRAELGELRPRARPPRAG